MQRELVSVGVARAALEQLEADLAMARDRHVRCANAVARTALAVLVDYAAEAAGEIIALDEVLYQRRHSLEALAVVLSSEGRRLNGQAPLPAQISRSLAIRDR